jgi:hypothetical protein
MSVEIAVHSLTEGGTGKTLFPLLLPIKLNKSA